LRGALVGGEPVKPSVTEGHALVPLRTTTADASVNVVLMYEQALEPLGGSGALDLSAPLLADVTGAEATWDVYLPSDYRVLRSRGVFGGPDRVVPDPWLFRVLGDVFRAADMAPGVAAGPESGDTELVTERTARAAHEVEYDRRKDKAPPKAEKKPSRPRARAAAREAEPMEVPAAATPAPAPSKAPPDLAKKRAVPPPILGLRGGLSLDIPIVPGGTHEGVRALGVTGAVRISYVDAPARESLGYVVSVLVVLGGLVLTGVVRWRGEGLRVPRLAFVVVVLAFATFAPGWFGARETTIWDALARGALWSAVVFVLVWIGRRIGGLRRTAGTAAAALLVLALLGTPAFAKGKKKPPPPKDDRETVYVPYNPTNPDLDAGGKVFIPFERFRELWNAAHPDRRIDSPEQAPVPWLLTGAGYEGSVEEETVRLRATYDLVVLSEGWLEVALPLAPAVVDEALVDGEPVRVLSRKGAHVLVLKDKGAHRITLSLRLLLKKEGDRRILAMALPAVPRSLLTFALPIDDPEVTLDGPVPPEIEGRKLTALLGSSGKLVLAWRPKTEAPKIAARVEAETREVLAALEGRFELRLRSTWRVVSGSIREVTLRLDPEFALLSVTGKDVKSFSVRDDRLTVELAREVKDATTVEVLAERADGLRARSVALPDVAPLGAVRERGLLAVAFTPDLRPTLSGPTNLDRITANAKDYPGLVPPGTSLHSAYRFVIRPLGLTVATEPVAAEVRL
ncbi:MAG: hypothetical protein ACYTDY_18470, partial [Planctomycetota bacterium]